MILRVMLVPILILCAAGCGPGAQSGAGGGGEVSDAPVMLTATAILKPATGSSVSGNVTFEQTADGVRVFATLSGLAPGPHGFHVHETGDCSAADASSAGGHFNPTQMPHGGPDSPQRHIGDLGNIVADEAGNANLERLDAHLSLEGANSIVGRAVIVHDGPDDMTSQPSGAAGPRLACGVIELR